MTTFAVPKNSGKSFLAESYSEICSRVFALFSAGFLSSAIAVIEPVTWAMTAFSACLRQKDNWITVRWQKPYFKDFSLSASTPLGGLRTRGGYSCVATICGAFGYTDRKKLCIFFSRLDNAGLSECVFVYVIVKVTNLTQSIEESLFIIQINERLTTAPFSTAWRFYSALPSIPAPVFQVTTYAFSQLCSGSLGK